MFYLLGSELLCPRAIKHPILCVCVCTCLVLELILLLTLDVWNSLEQKRRKKWKLFSPWPTRNRDKVLQIVYSVLTDESKEAAKLLNTPQKQTCKYSKVAKSRGLALFLYFIISIFLIYFHECCRKQLFQTVILNSWNALELM